MWEKFKAKIRGWKTVAFHGLVASSGAILFTLDKLNEIDFSKYVSPDTALLIGVGIGIAGIWLRYVTHTPLGGE